MTNHLVQQICHLDRSVAEWRDLRFPLLHQENFNKTRNYQSQHAGSSTAAHVASPAILGPPPSTRPGTGGTTPSLHRDLLFSPSPRQAHKARNQSWGAPQVLSGKQLQHPPIYRLSSWLPLHSPPRDGYRREARGTRAPSLPAERRRRAFSPREHCLVWPAWKRAARAT